MLKCLGVKSVDVAMLQYVNAKEYPMFLKPGGLVDAMKALQKEDKVRFIGISSHETPVLMDVIEGGRFDVVMTQINAACSAMPERQVLFNACASRNIGLIGTKPFIGGKLFKPGKKVRLAYYQTATETIILKTPTGITPACCLAHALKQPGVSSVIPGMQSVPEIESSLAYYTASPAARDDAKLVTLFTGHT
jgi:predicted aldo/keto reductase-like oxidoreductase